MVSQVDQNPKGGVKRRDFLAMVGAAAGLAGAGFPFLPKLSVAATPALEAAPAGAVIARVGIYPAIGICRVGGSQKWFLAPELPGVPPRPEGGFKDGTSKLKKQVQRFRVYAFDSEGRVISEVTDAEAKIEWRVHLANSKAAWYGFNNPLDNADAPGLPGQQRNQYFHTREQRERMLVIDPGAVSISGVKVNWDGDSADHAMTGRFWDSVDVSLGQVRTDEAGRLLVVPADGIADSPRGAPITSFADNDGWYDDWCDGPVDATVTLPDGRVLQADGAWLASVGPNFAPEIPPISTLYDVINSMNWEEGWTDLPEGPLSFRRDIYPTFRRTALMEWVSAAANLRKGWLDIGDFSDPDYLKRLADSSADNKAFRLEVLSNFRDPNAMSQTAFIEQHLKIPMMPGDGVNHNSSPLTWFQFPKLQYKMLELWAEGSFVDDFSDATLDQVTTIDQLPVAVQPHALTEAALEPCSGGAFHPGVELSYYLRLAPLYQRHANADAEPFRIARGNRASLVQNVGMIIDFEAVTTAKNGETPPIGPQMPGDLTRWMGLPWQPDAFSCQRVVMQDDFPTPVWWPALLPVDVLPEVYYEQMMREDLSAEERVKFFENRVWWARGVPGIGYHANASYWDGIRNMIDMWQEMGFVMARPGPADGQRPAGIPKTVYVEVGRGSVENRFDWQPDHGQLP
ncbi:CTQ-dependent glycine oxidase GoxA [Lamprobacter modestohalophilus]|uniref:CTQ-dependent glycine oxidase GoxA n=1 Tax=Lamprobacter modestohalophilus TaxID=1064514 RepID=UPI002ADEDE82|nr:CTQ-dependent glycine oxidase GoxA [Lamprobacter modestohalophilus]MEA1053233.1 CTQ-dependent glycine oxidase GoxA [Lamprobacter modestohalophilus]